jgi:cytochrome c peroxidase
MRLSLACSSLALALAAVPLLAAQDPASLPPGGPQAPHTGELPLGLERELPEPEGNAFDPARWELGRRLFFERELSVDRSVSCASCHAPERHFADGEALSVGVAGRRTLRNAPSLVNRGFGESFMWDGRVATLEEQVLMPVTNELEMDLPLEEMVARLQAHPSYPALFAAAFEDGVTQANAARALAQYVRRLVLGDSAVDRFRAGEYEQLSSEERVGLWVFESKGRCWRCHSGANFTDERFHNTGVGVVDGRPEEGRAAITGAAADRGAFKTPTLRGVALTAPYMHDGSLATLADVVAFYRRGGGANPDLDGLLVPLELSDREADGLVAFLEALSRPATGEAAGPGDGADAGSR